VARKHGEVEPVQLGVVTEPLMDLPRANRWISATLDGMIHESVAVFEANSCCRGRAHRPRGLSADASARLFHRPLTIP
jgi:hypothetical protein